MGQFYKSRYLGCYCKSKGYLGFLSKYLMSKNQYEPAVSTSRDSEDDLQGQGQNRPLKPPGKVNAKVKNTGALGLFGIVLYWVYRYYIAESLGLPPLEQSQYEFKVFCPINKIKILPDAENHLANGLRSQGQTLRFLQTELGAKRDSSIDQYIIYTQMRRMDDSINNSSMLFYCSYVTDWNTRDCSQAVARCSVPGPIFYLEMNVPIEVAWVYNIDDKLENINSSATEKIQYKTFAKPYSECYDASQNGNPSTEKFCTIARKLQKYQGCTYEDPTNITDKMSYAHDYRASTSKIPMTIHIHGLEVRPSFDGNPLSWVGDDGAAGVGFLSLLDKSYYANEKGFFKKPATTTLETNPNTKLYVKLNRYQNVQPAGNLWYHDHSMHLTQANVALGFAGDYIIYNPDLNKKLPQKEYEVLIVAGQNYINTIQDENTTVLNINNDQMAKDGEKHHLRMNPRIPLVATNLTFQRNQTYRVRILNGQYDSVFTDLRFLTECDESTPVINASTCRKVLSYTVIGSDSSLFHQTVKGVQNITIASAERFQLLIVFNGRIGNQEENTISNDTHYVLLVTGDNQYVHNRFPLQNKQQFTTNNFPYLPSQVNKLDGINYYNLSKQVDTLCSVKQTTNPTECIKIQRMRPFFHDNAFKFYFNGHFKFSTSGRSDNPKIGTTEDWILINTMFFAHPIHIHLINYQVIAQTTLKYFTMPDPNVTCKDPANDPSCCKDSSCIWYCPLYEIDYYLNAKVIQDHKETNITKRLYSLCAQVRNLNIVDPKVQKIMSEMYLQDSVNSDNSSISGFDVMPTFNASSLEMSGIYNFKGLQCQSGYKYVCGAFSPEDIPQWYKRWKEVALVQPFVVMQVRIRWTKTDYLRDGKGEYPYFTVNEDEIIEYPGYVYHCHFLTHEDSELMRSFMMQPSDRFKENYTPTGDFGDCVKKQSLKGKDEWKSRYRCINKYSSCPIPLK